ILKRFQKTRGRGNIRDIKSKDDRCLRKRPSGAPKPSVSALRPEHASATTYHPSIHAAFIEARVRN
ncbi:unnamed protein product, partial [Amoebophrya sp. A25]